MSTSGASTELAISRGGDARGYQGSGAGGPPGQAALAESLGTRLGPAATFATTEHFNLQTARAVTVSEANGRASIYLAALSGNLITLAFVGQMSRLGAAFYAFALILDRKSTRLNSSHMSISYAVFCLKKKKLPTLQ